MSKELTNGMVWIKKAVFMALPPNRSWNENAAFLVDIDEVISIQLVLLLVKVEWVGIYSGFVQTSQQGCIANKVACLTKTWTPKVSPQGIDIIVSLLTIFEVIKTRLIVAYVNAWCIGMLRNRGTEVTDGVSTKTIEVFLVIQGRSDWGVIIILYNQETPLVNSSQEELKFVHNIRPMVRTPNYRPPLMVTNQQSRRRNYESIIIPSNQV